MSQWWPEPYTDPLAEDEAAETAGIDADLVLAGMNAYADALYAAEARGPCPHWSLQHLTCTACGRVFGSDEDWMAAVAAVADGEEG